MTSGKGMALVAGTGIGAIVGYLLAHPGEAHAAPEGVDPETWNAIISIITAIQEQNARLESALTQLSSVLSSAVGGNGLSLQNPSSFTTGTVITQGAMRAVRMPAKIVPYDKEFVVKALDTNAGTVYVANSQPDAQILTAAWRLLPNEGIGLKIQKSDVIWIASQLAGEGVTFIVEQK